MCMSRGRSGRLYELFVILPRMARSYHSPERDIQFTHCRDEKLVQRLTSEELRLTLDSLASNLKGK